MSDSVSGTGEEELNPSPQGQDIEGLQQKFEQQQSLISQLKGTLQTSQQQRASREKEIEECAATLSSIKSRAKSSKRSSKSSEIRKSNIEERGDNENEGLAGTSRSVEEEVGMQVETDEKETEKKGGKKSGKNSEKARLLRKKLEENRMKFEQRGKEISENKKGIEEMVENLRMQLEERDNVIQTLQKGLESRAEVLVPAQELHIETERISRDSNEGQVIDRREMYAQIVYKDNKIVELNNRIMELELNVLDLQENLKEKDAVIDARTKAITLMSEDMSRKSKSTLDTLDDTREQMRLMQNNFITLEARMKDEKDQLNKQLEEKERKLKHIEESNKKLESVRFDLTTRIAELQEKVVHLQTINTEMQKQIDETSKRRENRGGREERIEELLRALDDSNKQMLKVKAQHKNKVKSLTKQIESLKKVSESSDEILRLQQRVAELEEDKGNLLLHLVDFDELKASEQCWKQRIHDLEEKVNQQNRDLDSHVRALSHLEEDKLNLIEDIQSERLLVTQLESDLETLKSKLTEVENLKVTAEMKAVELEELVDILSREKTELLQENKSLSEDRNEHKQLLDALQQEKSELLEEVMSLQAQVRESNPGDTDSNRSEFQMVSSNNSDEEKWKCLSTPEETLAEEKHVKDSSNIELSVKLLESELDDARKIISEQKDIIHDLNIKLESKEEEIEMYQEVISKLDQFGQEVGLREGHTDEVNKISEILKELNEMTGDLEEWKKRCSQVEDRLKCLEDEKGDLEKKLDEVINENSLLNSQLNLQKEVSEELASKLRESEIIISEKETLIREFKNINDENKLQLEIKGKELSELTSNLNSEDDVSSHAYQEEIISLKEDLENLRKVCSEYERKLVEKDAELLNVTTKLAEKIEAVNLKREVDETAPLHLQEKIDEKDLLIEQLKKQCEELENKIDLLGNINEEKSHHEDTSVQNSNKIRELEKLLSDKSDLLSQKEEELEKSYQKNKSITDKAKKVAVNLKAKTVVVQNLEDQQKKYLETIKEKEEIVSNMSLEIQNLCKEVESRKLQCEERDKTILDLSEKFESNFVVQESKIEELIVHNKHLTSVNETLSNDVMELRELLSSQSKCAKDNELLLTSHIAELEKQVNSLMSELTCKNDEIVNLVEQYKVLSLVEEERKLIEESKSLSEKKNQELIEEIMRKEEELTEISLKLDELSQSIEIKNEHLQANSLKYKELEQIIVAKDMQISALEDRTSDFQNSWSALDAKLQEREAFIESLEQELAKSQTQRQHLEEGLSFIEERRRSLENKFTALGEQLQESDRIKEEAEEHEGVLANRLAALASSEEILRKSIENLSKQNVDLTQRISELLSEIEDSKRNATKLDNNLKSANKEIERLKLCESEYHQALETIEKLEGDMRRSTIEFERSFKEKELQSRHYAENVELDMKNMSSQLTVLETEKRSLMEHCEKLNDIKINLEDEVETLQEKVDANHAKIHELEDMIKQKELDFRSIVTKREEEVVAVKEKLQQLERKLEKQDTIPCSVETKTVCTQSLESVDGHDDVNQLKSEIEALNNLLTQRENEVQTYQSRLLQLQFSGGGNMYSVSEEKDQSEKQMDISFTEMNEKLKLKESQLEELKRLVESANREISSLQLQLATSYKKIEEMSFEMCHLQEIIKSKDGELQIQMEKILDNTNSNKLSQQLESINTDFQLQLLSLQHQNSELYQELLQEKARNVVSEVVSTAHMHVVELKNSEESQSTFVHENKKSVRFEENVKNNVSESEAKLKTSPNMIEESFHVVYDSDIQNQSFNVQPNLQSYFKMDLEGSEFSHNAEVETSHLQINEQTASQELAGKLENMRAELDIVRNERSSALSKVEQLEMEVKRLFNVEKQLNDLHTRLNLHVSSSAEVGYELFSKESSVDSDKRGYGMDIHHSDDKIHVAAIKDSECIIGEANHSAQEKVPSAEHVDAADNTWGGENLDEEGWGWGAEEARLEEEHMQKQKAALSSSPLNDELKQHMSELQTKIELLEKERDSITDELKASQVRSGKMLKKLKDLKIKNESLMRENQELAIKKSSEFGSLDLAIEEELKIRIDSLEKELRECRGERDAVRVEKESIQKRVEILSAANERLAEREQGLDTEFWQNKSKELINQVETLQWRIEELMEEKPGGTEGTKEMFETWHTSDNSVSEHLKHEELQEQVAALAADNEQLQSMLEEQKNLRVAAEAALRDLQQFTSAKEANLLQEETNRKEEYMNLRENYDMLCKEVETMRSNTGNDSLIAENAALQENYDDLYRELQQLRSSSNSDIIAAEYSSMRNNYESMYAELEQLRTQVDVNTTLQANYESLQMAHDKLINEMNHIQKDYCDLSQKCEIIQQEKSHIHEEYTEKLRKSQENIDQLQNEKTELLMKHEKLSLEYSLMSEDLQHLRDEIEKYKTNVSTLLQEQERLNAVNCELHEKYQTLKHSENVHSNTLDKSSVVNISSLEESFKPIQFFSQSNKETDIDIAQKSSSADIHASSDGNVLENQIKEYKEQIVELEKEKQQKIDELIMLRNMFSSEQQDRANTEQALYQKIDWLEGELGVMKEAVKRESEIRESLMLKEHELSDVKSQLLYLEETLSKTLNKAEDLEAQLVQKEEEFQNININSENQESMIQQILASKEEDLSRLHEMLALKQQEQSMLLLGKEKDIENLKVQISDFEIEMKNLIVIKDQDIQNMKTQLSEMEIKMKYIAEEKDRNIETLQIQLAENNLQIQNLSQALQDKEQQVIELQEILEAREDEIREAVIQIRDRNIEIQQLKNKNSDIVSEQSHPTQVMLHSEVHRESESESSQQNELDFALYMLHQRDVRCEELTLELMQLLEERDTLQLRLSTALRINEELRCKINKCDTPSPLRIAPSTISKAATTSTDETVERENVLAPISPEPIANTEVGEPREDLKILADKLSQLHAVDYRRDVTLQDEREQRHSEQVMLLQPRAPGVLVESNYTLSRDVQSPSTVLLNWIWGRSTPKVMHI